MATQKKAPKNKTEAVLRHLQSKKYKHSITSVQAINLYGATRLSDIIFKLRKRGYDIVSQDKLPMKDIYGNISYFTKYVLVEDED